MREERKREEPAPRDLLPRIIAVVLVFFVGLLLLFVAYAVLSWLLNNLFVVAVVVGVLAIIGLAVVLYFLIRGFVREEL